HRFSDNNGRPLSALNSAAMKTLKTNVINLHCIEHGLRDLEREAQRQTHYRKRRRLEIRAQQIHQNIRAVLRQWHMPVYEAISGAELLKYQVAYKGSTTGRMYEYDGGIQNLPKVFKARAYHDIWVSNYDVRSCHIAIIAQLCREEGMVLHWTEAYVADKNSKYEYAKIAKIPVDIWKACLLGLYFGAVLNNSSETRVYQTIWDWLEEHEEYYTPEH